MTTSWLPQLVPTLSSEQPPTPWLPQLIAPWWNSQFRYLVVDEVLGGVVQLSISAWPVVDVIGRLRFPDAEPLHVHADAERFRLLLRRERQPRQHVSREARPGDAFGAAIAGEAAERFVSDVERLDAQWIFDMTHAGTSKADRSARSLALDPRTWGWMEPPIVDVTVAAREAAKLAYYGAHTKALPEEALPEETLP
jgi:hypothetical protein